MGRTFLLLLACAVVLLGACGGETTVRYDLEVSFGLDGDGQGQDRDGGPLGGDGSDWWKGNPDGEDPGADGGEVSEADAGPDAILEERFEIVPLHDDSKPLELLTGDRFPIKAKVLDWAGFGPASGYELHFKVISSTPACSGDPCAVFSQPSAMTDKDGVAYLELRAGTLGDTLYTVELSGQRAEPVYLEVLVKNPPSGNLRVNLQYNGAVPVNSINLRVVKGFFSCTQFNAVNPWTAGLVGQKTVAGLASKPVFEDLPVAGNFVLFATAKGPTGHLTAAGCVDAIHVLPDDQAEFTDVTLNLYLLYLQSTGKYDTVNKFNFTGAIPGQAGQVVTLVVTVFTNPGKIVVDLVKTGISQVISPLITDLVFSLFEDELAKLVSKWLLNWEPLSGFFTVGEDLIQIVNNLELHSELNLTEKGAAQVVQGVQAWKGLRLYWRTGCPPEGDPGFVDCAAHDFSLEDLDNTDFPLDLVSGVFSGAVANFDQLVIESHVIELNYGKLILFVLNKMILPKVSSYDSLSELLHSLVNCEAIGNGFAGDVLEKIGVGRQVVINFCNDAENWIISPVEGWISSLAADSNLRLQGKCTLVDDNDDLFVDRLTSGQWWGKVETGSGEAKPFEGTFEASKKN
jgi:hypothetical protein